MKLRSRWAGPPPRVGDYLMSPSRPRFAYRVCEVTRVDRIVSWDPELKLEFQHFTITAERVSLGSVPKSAKVHPWRWDKREPRRMLED